MSAHGRSVELLAAAAVLAVGLVELLIVDHPWRWALLVMLLVACGAALAHRQRPSLALGLLWFLAVLHVATGAPIMLAEVLTAMVAAFGCGRWGSPATLVASALSIPAACAGTIGLAIAGRVDLFMGLVAWIGDIQYALYYLNTGYDSGLLVTTALAGLAMLGLPWLAGVALRLADRAGTEQRGREVAEADSALARTQADQAAEIARLREQQTRLANDVHDVVGHSLAVILAQAESAQYADDVDTEKLKQTMSTIAESARSSLNDVRSVLRQDQPGVAPAEAPQLDALVEGLRRAGHTVLVHDEGTPRPLPPELATVAARVLQEMLTNAIRHGRPGTPVHVDRHWGEGSQDGELRLEVGNLAAPAAPPQETQPITVVPAEQVGGHGLPGMRHRLEAVGGRLDVRRRTTQDGTAWTVTAWVPTRDPR